MTKSGVGAFCLECDRKRVSKRREDPLVQVAVKKYSANYRAANIEVVRYRDRAGKLAKQEWLNTLKDESCVDCGLKFPSCCMDFDHVRGIKLKGIGELLGCTQEVVLSEISKCDLVCACCHRLRTTKQRGSTSNPTRVRYHSKISELKFEKSCLDCGRVLPPITMDFDHVRGVKVMTIAQMRSVSWSKALLEIEKCDLVCANCHRVRTNLRRILEAA